jgi:lipid II:glycine glycyltransferase (peptidoglycan interpeptide bridge formation enzyme)
MLMPHSTLVTHPTTWHNFVLSQPYAHLLQTWEWGEFKARFGWKPVRLALIDETRVGAPMRAGGQILLRRLPLGLGAIGYAPKGPMLAPDSPLLSEWLAAVKPVARAERICFLRLEPAWEQTQIPHLQSSSALGNIIPNPHIEYPLSNIQTAIQPTTTIHIDLRPSPEAILTQMKPKWRYNIRLAERKGVTVRLGTEADLVEFYRLSQVTSQRDGFAIHTEAYYRTAWQLFQPSHSGALFIAEFAGKAIAAIMVFVCARMAIYLYGASSNEDRHRMPNHLLQWRAMLWAKERGCEVYDLWGVPEVRDEGQATGDERQEMGNEEQATSDQLPLGLLRFKEGFGGRVVRYVGAYDIVYRPWLYRLLQWAETRRRNLG